MTLTSGDYHGLPTHILSNPYLRLEFLAQAGPRIVRFSPAGSEENLFAEVPDFKVDTAYGAYSFHGGHRLWHAPEAVPRSYILDDAGLSVEPLPNGARLLQPTEAHTGIGKQIEIHLQPDRAAVVLHHSLKNEGVWPVELAPWALTQMRLGGFGVFPQPRGPLDAAGLLPNRRFAFWPYSRWDDARLHLNDEAVIIQAQPGLPPFKFGYLNPHGWMGYWYHNVFFCKRFSPPQASDQYPDFGCNTETYCNDRFYELESLGPLRRLEPGETVCHTETWEVMSDPAPVSTPEGVITSVRALGLLA
jgi:hypothetical protein